MGRLHRAAVVPPLARSDLIPGAAGVVFLVLLVALGAVVVGVARGGGPPSRVWVLAALAAAAVAAAVVGAVAGPEEGWRVVAVAAVPPVLVAADLAVAATGGRAARPVHVAVVVAVATYVVVTGFSIGLAYVPALVLLAVAAGTTAVERRPPRSAATPPAPGQA